MRIQAFGRTFAALSWVAFVGCAGGGDGSSGGEETGERLDVQFAESGEETGDVADVSEDTEDAPVPDDVLGSEDIQDVDEADVPVEWPIIVINEVLVKADGNFPDWIELTSMHGETVDLAGWGIRDELNAHDYLLPEGTILEAFSYKVIWGKGGDQELTMDFGFKVDAKARLFAPDGTQVDEADWEEGDAPAGTSWGRFPDGFGEFQTLTEPTLGKVNKPPAQPADSGEDAP